MHPQTTILLSQPEEVGEGKHCHLSVQKQHQLLPAGGPREVLAPGGSGRRGLCLEFHGLLLCPL